MDHIVDCPAARRPRATSKRGTTSPDSRSRPPSSRASASASSKFLAYGWSSDRSIPAVRDQVGAALAEARHTGWDGLLAEQRAYLDEFWAGADVELDGDAELQQAVRFALFHTLQAGARVDGRAIAAKGLTGPGLRRPLLLGHRVVRPPGPDLHRPERGRSRPALAPPHPADRARASRPARPARARRSRGGRSAAANARPTGRPGRPPSTSAPTSPTPSPATRPRPTTTTSPTEVGTELLVETARLWRSLGHHDPSGHFHIDGVTGPDEYSSIADNNVYTNLMAQRNLRNAADAVEHHPARAAELGVDAEEAASWRDAAAGMVVPVRRRARNPPPGRGLHPPRDMGFRPHEARAVPAAAATSPTSTSTASRSSSRPISCSRSTPAATRSPPSRRPATSPTTSS